MQFQCWGKTREGRKERGKKEREGRIFDKNERGS